VANKRGAARGRAARRSGVGTEAASINVIGGPPEVV
jgi:hypothetical protein